MAKSCDFLIIGGGVIGVILALELKRRYPGAAITLLEKEAETGLHGSGRNSGVLHAGFYYTADSLKARLTREGCAQMTDYCRERGLKLNPCGKLVPATSEAELKSLEILLERGRANGVELEELDERQAREIEPRIKVHEKALFSPTTAAVDPGEVMASLVAEARQKGVEILTNAPFLTRLEGNRVITGAGEREAGYVVNAAGLYADKVARQFGFSRDFAILPFKGLYLYSDEPQGALRTHVYPVPDLEYPFLGVHFTLTAEGKTKIGPTAIPAFWREHYAGLEGFDAGEFLEIVLREAGLLLRNDFNFRTLAIKEMAKYRRTRIVELASRLLQNVEEHRFTQWGRPGIRAQLIDLKRRKLEMDFRIEGDHRSLHILNAVSPAFTCAFSFTGYAVDEIEKRIEPP